MKRNIGIGIQNFEKLREKKSVNGMMDLFLEDIRMFIIPGLFYIF